MSFANKIIAKYKAEFPVKGTIYDRYFLWNKHSKKPKDFHGYSSLYKFVNPVFGKKWIEIYDSVSSEIKNHISENHLKLVSFYLKDKVMCPHYFGQFSAIS